MHVVPACEQINEVLYASNSYDVHKLILYRICKFLMELCYFACK